MGSLDISQVAALVAGSGTLAMAVVETWKEARRSKSRFYRKQLAAWLDRLQRSNSSKVADGPGKCVSSVAIFSDLISLCSAGEGYAHDDVSDAFFAMDSPQFFARIEAALDILLRNPGQWPDLFDVMFNGGRAAAIAWKGYCIKPAAERTEVDTREATDNFALLQRVMKWHVDSLQLTADYLWGRGNRIAAIIVGPFVLSGCIAWLYGTAFLCHWKMVPLVILGGVAAPVSKNVVDALRDLKGKLK